MGSNFKRGYGASRKEIKRQEERRSNMRKRLFRFFISAGKNGESAEAEVTFLTEEPVNFYEHTVAHDNGKKFEYYTCIGRGCPLCEQKAPTAKGAYLVIDHRPYEVKDKNGNKKRVKESLRLYVAGMRNVSQLDRISSRRGLCNKYMNIVRMGSGTRTIYTFEDGEENKISRQRIKDLMPDSMKEEWDGTTDGLMDIIEEQLKMAVPDGADNDSKDDDEDYGDEWKISVVCLKNFVGDSINYIPVGCRLVQFRIIRKQPEIGFIEVDDLGNENRNGFGSTGR